MSERIACCVPFCGRTTKEPVREWICGNHWPLVSRSVKRRRAKVRRMLKRTSDPERRGRLIAVDEYLWRLAKKQAAEGAAGI